MSSLLHLLFFLSLERSKRREKKKKKKEERGGRRIALCPPLCLSYTSHLYTSKKKTRRRGLIRKKKGKGRAGMDSFYAPLLPNPQTRFDSMKAEGGEKGEGESPLARRGGAQRTVKVSDMEGRKKEKKRKGTRSPIFRKDYNLGGARGRRGRGEKKKKEKEKKKSVELEFGHLYGQPLE